MDRIEFTGGCLCGQLRYEARGAPIASGFCCCADCRKASGSGFIPFIVIGGDSVRFDGETRQVRSPAFTGGEAVRNFCPDCGGLVFGGEAGKDDSHTLYAGSLDDAALFRPTLAIFTRDRPAWVALPEGLALHETLPD